MTAPRDLPSIASPGGTAPLVVLSPHFDDAVVSCGGLLGAAHQAGRATRVVTVFAREPPRARVALRHRVFARYGVRRAEDDRALALLGARSERLDFVERVFRTPRLRGLGAVFRALPRDGLAGFANLAAIRAALDAMGQREPDAVFLAPLGVGNHYDHVEVFLAALTLWVERPAWRTRLWFYEDPYALMATARERHFVTRRLPRIPTPSTRLAAWIARLHGIAQGGPGLEQLLPTAARKARWTAVRVSAAGQLERKVAAVEAYASQARALGGAAWIRALRASHASWGDAELLWQLDDG